MANSKLASPTAETMSSLPECAICLETCTNKCHSDSCMHQFCYKCLLGWSEIKEECPVCKQAFKSIIHDNKYDDDKYLVEDLKVEDNHRLGNARVYLPRIDIHETVVSSDHDSDVIVVSDTNDNQEDQSSDSIINVVDTDSDRSEVRSIPLSQMVSKVGPEEEPSCSTTRERGNRRPIISSAKLVIKNGHKKWKARTKKRQRHMASSSGSSSATSASESTESTGSDSDSHDMYQNRKRFKKKFKGKKKANRKTTH